MRQRTTMPSRRILHEELDYNPENGLLKWKKPAKGRAITNQVGCRRKDRYWVLSFRGAQYLLHRIIWKIMTGDDPPAVIDHIDGDPSNNAWANLRAATEAQNHQNQRLRGNNTSGVKGVTWSKSRNKWQATLRIPGRRFLVGRFETIEEAENAIRQFRELMHQEFARHS